MNVPDPRPDDDLVAFLDGQLDPSRSALVQRRLDGDPAFARRAAELRALDELLGAHPAAFVKPGAVEAVLAAARRESAAAIFRKRLFRGAAAAVVVMAVGLSLHLNPGPVDPIGGTTVPSAPTAPTGPVGEIAPEALASFAALVPAVEAAGDADLAELEASLDVIARVQSDYFSE